MLNPIRKITQISTVLVPLDGHSRIVVIALCDDGSAWQLSRDISSGAFDAWEPLPAIPQGVR